MRIIQIFRKVIVIRRVIVVPVNQIMLRYDNNRIFYARSNVSRLSRLFLSKNKEWRARRKTEK